MGFDLSDVSFPGDSVESSTMEVNDLSSTQWTLSSGEALMIGLVLGVCLGHYFFMLKNGNGSTPQIVQRNLRRPEL